MEKKENKNKPKSFLFWSKQKNIRLWSRDVDKKIFRILRRLGIAVVVLLLLTASILVILDEYRFQTGFYDNYFAEDSYDDGGTGEASGKCNIQGIELHGYLMTYIPLTDFDADGNLLQDETASENIIYQIHQAEKDDSIKAIALEIDSYGGYPSAAEEVANALKQAQKPTVALIRQGGVSGAYLAATGADIIFASKYSDVGSIGVTMSYLDNVTQNQAEGLSYNQLSSGKFKDTGDPNRTLSAEEKDLLMRDVEIIHQNFVKAVAGNRNLDITKVESLADGSTMLGEMALENGLIDKIGGLEEVEAYLADLLGKKNIEICW